jgi:hypothetical protein
MNLGTRQPLIFDKGLLVYDVVTPFLLKSMEDFAPCDMVISCRGASGCGEHILHMPTNTTTWCSPRSLHRLRTQIYNEIIVYMVPLVFKGQYELTVQVLPNLGLRMCMVKQDVLEAHKRAMLSSSY